MPRKWYRSRQQNVMLVEYRRPLPFHAYACALPILSSPAFSSTSTLPLSTSLPLTAPSFSWSVSNPPPARRSRPHSSNAIFAVSKCTAWFSGPINVLVPAHRLDLRAHAQDHAVDLYATPGG
ncbi:hypothetical protein FIBSPDRAFT_865246, partial [Athelia psychrophila]